MHDICGMLDILAKMSSFNLFFIETLLEHIVKLCVKNFMWNYEKQIQLNLQK